MPTATPFAIPGSPEPPKPVAAAQDQLVTVATRLAELDASIREAEQAVRTARQQDVAHIRDEALENRVVTDPHEREHQAQRQLDTLRAQRQGVAQAVAVRNAELQSAIKQNLAPWQAAVDKQMDAAHQRYIKAISQAQAAAGELAAARAADRFLEQFEPGYLDDADVRTRSVWPMAYTGGDRLELPDVKLDANTARNATELLAALRTLDAKPPKPPEPRRLDIKASHPGDGSIRIADPQTAGFTNGRR